MSTRRDDHGDAGDDAEGPRHEDGLDGASAAALGSLSEALEYVERARGHLYAFHQLTGTADAILDRAVAQLRTAGHADLAEQVRTELIGRNVVTGRWSFEVVEEYDDTYWSVFRSVERAAREALAGGRRHVHEARMKADRRRRGRPDHRDR